VAPPLGPRHNLSPEQPIDHVDFPQLGRPTTAMLIVFALAVLCSISPPRALLSAASAWASAARRAARIEISESLTEFGRDCDRLAEAKLEASTRQPRRRLPRLLLSTRIARSCTICAPDRRTLDRRVAPARRSDQYSTASRPISRPRLLLHAATETFGRKPLRAPPCRAVKARSPKLARCLRLRSRVTPDVRRPIQTLPDQGDLTSSTWPTFGRPTIATVKLRGKGSAVGRRLSRPQATGAISSSRRNPARRPHRRGLLPHRRRAGHWPGMRLAGGAWAGCAAPSDGRMVTAVGPDSLSAWRRLLVSAWVSSLPRLSRGLGLVRLRLHVD